MNRSGRPLPANHRQRDKIAGPAGKAQRVPTRMEQMRRLTNGWQIVVSTKGILDPARPSLPTNRLICWLKGRSWANFEKIEEENCGKLGVFGFFRFISLVMFVFELKMGVDGLGWRV